MNPSNAQLIGRIISGGLFLFALTYALHIFFLSLLQLIK